jgi:hypothetical protein
MNELHIWRDDRTRQLARPTLIKKIGVLGRDRDSSPSGFLRCNFFRAPKAGAVDSAQALNDERKRLRNRFHIARKCSR